MAESNETTGQQDSGLSKADFMRLLMQHEPALRAFARSLLPDWHTVDEVIQEASMTLWEKFDQLRSEAGFLPWAKVIVRFKCLSAIGTLRKSRAVFSDGVLELLADEAEAIEAETHDAARDALRSCLQNFSKPHQALRHAMRRDCDLWRTFCVDSVSRSL